MTKFLLIAVPVILPYFVFSFVMWDIRWIAKANSFNPETRAAILVVWPFMSILFGLVSFMVADSLKR